MINHRSAEKHCEHSYQQRPSIESHPQPFGCIIAHEAHVLDPSGRPSVVRNPILLAGAPREEQIAAGPDGDIVAGLVSNLKACHQPPIDKGEEKRMQHSYGWLT